MARVFTINRSQQTKYVVCRSEDYYVFHYVELQPQQELATGQPEVNSYGSFIAVQQAAGVYERPRYYQLGNIFITRYSDLQNIPEGAIEIIEDATLFNVDAKNKLDVRL